MALLDIVIEVLKINCSAVQCTGYASEIEGLFFLLFFPTVFIILFTYVVSGIILEKTGGKEGALKLLIGVTMVAFIIFQGWFSFFISLSKLWWLLIVGLVGLFIFIKQMVHGGGGGGGFGTAKSGRGVGGYISKQVRNKIEGNEKDLKIGIEKTLQNLESHVNLMEREVEKPSPGTNMANMLDSYNSQKRAVLDLCNELNNMGKANISSLNLEIVKKARKYYDELAKLDDRVTKITKKIKK